MAKKAKKVETKVNEAEILPGVTGENRKKGVAGLRERLQAKQARARAAEQPKV